MSLHDLVTTSAAVGEASGRLAKIGLLADLLRRLAPEEIEIAIGFLSGEPRQGRIGIGGATIWSGEGRPAADTPSLQPARRGRGVHADRRDRRARARPPHASSGFAISWAAPPALSRTSSSGCCSASCVRARSRACWSKPSPKRAGSALPHVRRAVMMAGALAPVARAAIVDGEAGLADVRRPTVSARSTDAGAASGRHERGADATAQRRLARVEAGRRADPGAQERRRGPCLLAESARRDVRRSRSRRCDAIARGARADRGRRGHRAPCRTARRIHFRSRCSGLAGSSMWTGCAPRFR